MLRLSLSSTGRANTLEHRRAPPLRDEVYEARPPLVGDEAAEPAARKLEELVTAGGKIPLAHAVEMLGEIDGHLFHLISVTPEALFFAAGEPEAVCDEAHVLLDVWRNDFHRIFIRDFGGAPEPSRPLSLSKIGCILAPAEILEEARRRAGEGERSESAAMEALESVLFAAERSGSLGAMLEVADDAVRHVESVCLYIADQFFGVVERHTNLVDPRGYGSLFKELSGSPVGTWRRDHRLLVIALWSLFRSGRSVRFEEFSGKVLTARRLLARLEQLRCAYRLPGPSLLESPTRLADTSAAIGDFALKQAPEDLLRYRHVNGITYLKCEQVIERRNFDDGLEGASPRLLRLLEELGARPSDEPSARAVFKAAACALFDGPAARVSHWMEGTPAHSPMEILIQEVVASAVACTRADYGMSSSLRRPGVLMTSSPECQAQAMLTLTTKDFFTCVTARPALSHDLDGDIVEDIYRPVQTRMQFNRWHFIPGNFLRSEVPLDRHFFYPPVLPDLDEWVDQHHKGHIRAWVRYSIRSPAPDMHEPALIIGGRAFRGFYDVRVVRMNEPAFELEDLIAVRRHCNWLGAAWKAWLELMARDRALGRETEITGFRVGEGFELPD